MTAGWGKSSAVKHYPAVSSEEYIECWEAAGDMKVAAAVVEGRRMYF